MSLLDSLLFGVRDVFDAMGNVLPRRSRIKFTGNVYDDPTNDRTVVELPSAASLTTEQDVGRSVPGGPIDRVLGWAGRLLAVAAPRAAEAYRWSDYFERFIPTDQEVHVELYGAVADADGSKISGGADDGKCSKDGGSTLATPNADAFERAIKALDSIRGGIVNLGFTRGKWYRLERPVIVDRPVRFRGQGRRRLFPGTGVLCDIRVTGFRTGQGAFGLTVTGGDESGFYSSFERFLIKAVARDTTVVIGDWDISSTTITMTDAAAASLKVEVGDVLSVGACDFSVDLARLTVSTREGYSLVVVRGSGTTSGRGMFAGQYLTVGTSFPNPTKTSAVVVATIYSAAATYAIDGVIYPTTPNGHAYVVESGAGVGGSEPVWPTNGTTIATGGGVVFRDLGLATDSTATYVDMAANAAVTETSTTKVHTNLPVRVTGKSSAAGMTTLTTDALNGGQDRTGVDIRRFDCGIDMRYMCELHSMLIEGFEGSGVLNSTNGAAAQNTNFWHWSDVHVIACRHACIVRGQNAQAGGGRNIKSVQSREWCFILSTQAGNHLVGTHVDGGAGILVSEADASTIVDPYVEGGTFNSYGPRGGRCQVFGGTGESDAGGTSCVSGTWNFFKCGEPAHHTHQRIIDPDAGWEEDWRKDGGDSIFVGRWRRANQFDGVSTGFSCWAGPGTRAYGLVRADDDCPAYLQPMDCGFPRGLLEGGLDGAGNIDPTLFRRRTVYSKEPRSQIHSPVLDRPTRVGDEIRLDGTDATFRKYYALLARREGLNAEEWKPGMAVAIGFRMRLPKDADTFVYEVTTIGSAITGTDPSVIVPGATITESTGVVWTRTANTSAIYDRMGPNMSLDEVEWLGGGARNAIDQVDTTDDTPTTLGDPYEPEDSAMFRITREIMAKRTDAVAGARFVITGCWIRVGGSLEEVEVPSVLVGEPTDATHRTAAASAYRADFDIDGTAVGTQVTGTDGHDVTWQLIEERVKVI